MRASILLLLCLLPHPAAAERALVPMVGQMTPGVDFSITISMSLPLRSVEPVEQDAEVKAHLGTLNAYAAK